MYPGEVTRVIATFDREGLYEWHCHILSHEDHEMMRPFFVGTINSENVVTRVEEKSPDVEEQMSFHILPNPFNGYLTMRFTLAGASNVQVNLYNAQGSLVNRLYNGRCTAGQQQFTFKAESWSSGTYFAEIIVGNQRMTRKLILQK